MQRNNLFNFKKICQYINAEMLHNMLREMRNDALMNKEEIVENSCFTR